LRSVSALIPRRPEIARIAARRFSLAIPAGLRLGQAAIVVLAALIVIVAVPPATVRLASDPLVLASDGNPSLGVKPSQP